MNAQKITAIATVSILFLMIGKFGYDYQKKQQKIKDTFEMIRMEEKFQAEQHQIEIERL